MEYVEIFYGNFSVVTRIKSELETEGIVPVIKDEGESQRLAGFGSMSQGQQTILVHENELDRAENIVNRVKSEIESLEA